MKRFFDSILSFIFPIECIVCKKDGIRLCSHCVDSLQKCEEAPYPWIHSVFHYKDTHVRKAVQRLKYFHDQDLINIFADILGEELLEDLIDKTSVTNRTTYLVPVPMHKKRLRDREKNTSLLLAKAVQKHLSIPTILNQTILTKEVATKPQAETKSRSERLRNVTNSCEANINDTRGLYILIDDVTTTGATLVECKRALRAAGAQHVYAVTLAH